MNLSDKISKLRPVFYHLSIFFLCGMVVTIPYSQVYFNHIFNILFCLSIFLSLPPEEIVQVYRLRWKWILLFISPVVIHILGLIFYSEIARNFELLIRISYLGGFPLVVLIRVYSRNDYYKVFLSYVLSCLVLVFISWSHVLYLVFTNNEPISNLFLYYYSYQNLVDLINVQANYIALFILVASLFIVYLYHVHFFKNRWVVIAVSAVFILFQMHLAVRMVLFSYLLIGACYFTYQSLQKKKIIPLLSYFIAVMLFVGLTYSVFSYLNWRLFGQTVEIRLDNKSFSSVSFDVKEKRVDRWYAALEVVKENPIFGLGPAQSDDRLLEVYEKNNLNEALHYKYNAHNQFLQILLSFGIVGLMIFIASLVVPLIFYFRLKLWLPFLFIVCFSLFSFTESSLRRHKGIVFYGLMNALMFSYAWSKKGVDKD